MTESLTLRSAERGAFRAAETIVAVQVHGNTLTADDEIRRLAGVTTNAPFTDRTIDEVTARLRATGRFQSVQVLKRFASIADPSQVLLVIVVDEGPVSIERTGDPNQPVRAVRDRRPRVMFLPILSAEDGYGATYGIRFALPDPAGKSSRVAFPLTWGGEKRAGAELDKALTRGPFDRLFASASISRRTNPFYDADDDRLRGSVRGERAIRKWLRVGVTGGADRESMLSRTDAFGFVGGDVTFDTRVDPILPRNAAFARATWEYDGVAGGVQRTELDARGYVGVFRQNVLALRALRIDSDAPLPPYLKPLLGGLDNVRGFRTGVAAGDTLVATSAELVVPLTSPLNFGQIGVSAFADSGTTYDKGARLADQTWRKGVGGSVWFSAAFVRVNVAVAHGIGATTRVHVGANVSF